MPHRATLDAGRSTCPNKAPVASHHPGQWSKYHYKVLDANGQSLAYVFGRETRADADIANGAHDGRSPAHRGEYREAADLLIG